MTSVVMATKRTLLFPCLDRMIAELDQRFTGVSVKLLKGIQACSPASDLFLSEQRLQITTRLKSEEVMVAKNVLARKKEAGAAPLDMVTVYSCILICLHH